MSLDEKLVKFLTNFIVESDAIENITANPNLVLSQLKRRLKKGYVGALLYLESLVHRKDGFLTKGIICRVQGLITAEQHTKPGGPTLNLEWIGAYRMVNVSIGGKIAPLPIYIPALMKEWIISVALWQKEYRAFTKGENLSQIAFFHFDYEHIHPFVDGNGRSGRAIVYYLMRHCGMNPFVFTSYDKYETYYRCFNKPEEMYKYFRSKFYVL